MSIQRALYAVLINMLLLAAVAGTSSAAPPDPKVGPEITVSDEFTDQYIPAVAYNWKHNEYLVVWHNTYFVGTRDVWGRRYSLGGQPLSNVFLIASSETKNKAQPAVDYDPVNDRYLVVWRDEYSSTDWDVYGRFVPWNGPSVTLTEFSIISWSTNQWNPKVAYSRVQQEFLVVWNNELTPYWDISGVRVNASTGATLGTVLDISHASQNRVNADVAYNFARNEYLVVSDNGLDVFAQRVAAADLTKLGGELTPAGWSNAETQPAVAACSESDQYVVAWQSLKSGPPSHNDVYVRFIDGDGTYPAGGGPFEALNSGNHEQYPDVTCGTVGPNATGGQFLLTWEQQYNSTSGPYGIWGQFFSTDLDGGPWFKIVNPTIGYDRTSPAVIGGEGSFMAVWEHDADRGGSTYQDIHAALISPYAVYLPLTLRGN